MSGHRWFSRAAWFFYPWFPRTWSWGRQAVVIVFGFVGFLMLVALGIHAHDAYRFTRHAETVDATLVERLRTQCIGASGSPGLVGRGANVWIVEFPTRDGLHRTRLRHPCDVVPPDFGRGRGAMWIQYDVDNPDRVRVLNDTEAEDALVPYALSLVLWGTAGYVLQRSLRRAPAGTARPPRASSLRD